ncbi:MAG: recombinase family protein [Acidimicrobiales bacterium]
MQHSPFSLVRGVIAFGYVRVSTAEQAAGGLGMDAQRHAIHAACDQRRWVLQEIYEDAGVSSTAAHRPGLESALAACRSHPEALLIVAKLDRLSRSILEFATLVERMKHEPWRLVALDLGVDTTTPNGEFVANVMSSFAQFERQMISVRTKEALAAARERGVQVGRRTAVSDEIRRLILRLHECDGWSATAIARYLEAIAIAPPLGGSRWHTSTVTRVIARAGGSLKRGRPRSIPSESEPGPTTDSSGG